MPAPDWQPDECDITDKSHASAASTLPFKVNGSDVHLYLTLLLLLPPPQPMASKQLKSLTRDEVAKVFIILCYFSLHAPDNLGPFQHNKDGDLWVIIDAKVYDLSRFKDLHPGGAAALIDPEVGKIHPPCSNEHAAHERV